MGGAEQVQALWREAGRWWEFEPYREVSRIVTPHGALREAIREGRSLGSLAVGETAQKPLCENYKEEWSLRERKIRDEKVAAACGDLPRSYYERRADSGSSRATSVLATVRRASSYVPLHCLSGYAFGRSTMLAEEIPVLAALAGCPAAGIADPFSLVGVVEFAKACRRAGIQPLVGASFELEEGGSIVLIARSKRAYTQLSQLITACHLEEPRGFPLARWSRLERFRGDFFCLTGGDSGPLDRRLAQRQYEAVTPILERLVALYGTDRVILEVERSFLPWQRRVEQGLVELAERYGLRLAAGGLVTHARREHFAAQDVLTCIETLCGIEEVVGRKPQRDASQPQVPTVPMRALNAERYLRTVRDMATLFCDRPEWLDMTCTIAQECDPDVLPARTSLPPLFGDDAHALREIVMLNAHGTYPKLTSAIRARLDLEVERIIGLGFATHFLVAFDMVRWAKEQGIQLSGRGSVVDSAVAYVLGFSRIDAIQHRLHFDRFLPGDGNKRPDIDIDFEARRRDEVRGYLTHKYGVERVATVAAVGAFCTRGIVREVGKVFGLPDATIGFLAKNIHGGVPADQIEAALDRRPELRDHPIPRERFRWVMRLAQRLMDVPRNMRSHSSGVVLSSAPISDTVPVQWGAAASALTSLEALHDPAASEAHLRILQWDKRSSKDFFDKFDLLCLRGQDVLSGIQERARVSDPEFNVERTALDDPETFRAFRSGELIGVPQSASPAMRQAHVRLRTENLADASLVQAGIRPGVGGAVKINELIARRRGKPYTFAHPQLETILGHTYGIIVFQEQVDQLLQAFCGCSAGEAEDLREQIHKRRREDFGAMIRDQILKRIQEGGHSLELAEIVYDYIAGFKGYGFAEGHALAFAEISIRCVHLMQNHPAEYFAALLSAQPAGYYGPCTLANEARTRGVAMLRPSVQSSRRVFTVEGRWSGGLWIPGCAIRTGWMQVRGLSRQTAERMEKAVEQHVLSTPEAEGALLPLPKVKGRSRVAVAPSPADVSGHEAQVFKSFFDFVARIEPERDELEALILCGAFDELLPHRRALLWAVPEALRWARGQKSGTHPSLPFLMPEPEIDQSMADFDAEERAAYERAILEMDIDQHLMAFERPWIAGKAITTEAARRLRPGEEAIVVGNPIRLRFPPTPSGKRVVFFDLEDESGLLNVTCFDRVYQRDGKAIVTAPYVTLVGVGQDRDGHTAFLAHRVFAYRPRLLRDRVSVLPVRQGDFLVSGQALPRMR